MKHPAMSRDFAVDPGIKHKGSRLRELMTFTEMPSISRGAA